MKIAHLADLHFTSFSWDPLQLFSKEVLGTVNYFVSRRKKYLAEKLEALPSFLSSAGVSHVIICGDLTTTSREEEFHLATSFVQKLRDSKLEVLTLPGNHDAYTQKAFRSKRFYQFFPQRGPELIPLTPGWKCYLLDTAIATPWTSSRGLFSEASEKKLRALLEREQDLVLLANHYPFFCHDAPRKQLLRAKELEQLLRDFPQVTLYLHGHTHRHCLADLRPDGLPIILDSGSTTLSPESGLNLIDLERKTVQPYAWRAPSKTWEAWGGFCW